MELGKKYLSFDLYQLAKWTAEQSEWTSRLPCISV